MCLRASMCKTYKSGSPALCTLVVSFINLKLDMRCLRSKKRRLAVPQFSCIGLLGIIVIEHLDMGTQAIGIGTQSRQLCSSWPCIERPCVGMLWIARDTNLTWKFGRTQGGGIRNGS
jgi:hypothetical protein